MAQCDAAFSFHKDCAWNDYLCFEFPERSNSGAMLSRILSRYQSYSDLLNASGQMQDDHSSHESSQVENVVLKSSTSPPKVDTPRVISPPSENVKQQFISFLEYHPLARFLGLSWYDTFLHEVPQLLGNSPVLDAAAACIASTDATSPSIATVSTQSAAHYQRSLRLMQAALLDEQQSRSPLVLCATTLLQAYELCATPNHTSWIQHAGGAARLIQSQGPQAHRDGISRAILEALRGSIVVHCIVNRRHCFLADAPWVEAISEDKLSFYSEFEDSRIAHSRLRRHQLYLILAYLPGILQDSARWIKIHTSKSHNRSRFPSQYEVCIALLTRVLALRRSLTSWRLCHFGTLGYIDASNFASEGMFAPLPSQVLERRGSIYSEHVSASLDCVANCSLIIINCLLSNLIPTFDALRHDRTNGAEFKDRLPTEFEMIQQTGLCADIASRAHTFTKAHCPASSKWITHGFRQAWYTTSMFCSINTKDTWKDLNGFWDSFEHSG